VLALAYCGTTTPEALATLAQARLARYKQPRLYLPLAALPRSANGKLDRKALVALLKDRS
jgi:acyl-CoA synthetase (AMP-forming)/AMP-acid ligase II